MPKSGVTCPATPQAPNSTGADVPNPGYQWKKEALEKAMEEMRKLEEMRTEQAKREEQSTPNTDADEEFMKNTLESISIAEELIEAKEKREREKQNEWNKLPLLRPGKTYKREEAAGGFRVLDGYAVSYNQKGDIKVGKHPYRQKRQSPFPPKLPQ